MKRHFILIIAMLICTLASAQNDYYKRKAASYTIEAEYWQKKADGYRREAEYHMKKAEGHQRNASYYTRKGDLERARTYVR